MKKREEDTKPQWGLFDRYAKKWRVNAWTKQPLAFDTKKQANEYKVRITRGKRGMPSIAYYRTFVAPRKFRVIRDRER